MAEIAPVENEDSENSVVEIEPPKKPAPLVIDLADEEIVINVKTEMPNKSLISKVSWVRKFKFDGESPGENGENNANENEEKGEESCKEGNGNVNEKNGEGNDKEKEEDNEDENDNDEVNEEDEGEEEDGETEEDGDEEANEEDDEEGIDEEDEEEIEEGEEEIEDEGEDDNSEDDNDEENEDELDDEENEDEEDENDEESDEAVGENIESFRGEEGEQTDDDETEDDNKEDGQENGEKKNLEKGVGENENIDDKQGEGNNDQTKKDDEDKQDDKGKEGDQGHQSTSNPDPATYSDDYYGDAFFAPGSYVPASYSLNPYSQPSYSQASHFQASQSQPSYSQPIYPESSFFPAALRRRMEAFRAKRPRVEDEKETYHPTHWTPEMVKYYDEDWGNEKDFVVEKLQEKMDKDPSLWQISSRDVAYWTSKKKKGALKCFNCLNYGHEAYSCKEEKRETKCHMCGLPGHIAYKCPQAICLNCGSITTGYVTKCENCKFGLDKVCERCNLTGHIYSECTDHWRLYHSTVGTNRVREPMEEIYKPTRYRWCCNCGRRGHLQVDCGFLVKNCDFSDSLPFVSSYIKAFTRSSQLSYGYEDPASLERLEVSMADNIMTNPSQKHIYHRKTSQLRNRLRAIKRDSVRRERERDMERRRHSGGGGGGGGGGNGNYNRYRYY